MLRRSILLGQATAAAAVSPDAAQPSPSVPSAAAKTKKGSTGKHQGGKNKKGHTAATATAATNASPLSQLRPLLGYPIRRAAAAEMLYGGVRTNYLNQKPFTLHKTRSEDLPSPSLDRERHDLQLEMQLPRDGRLGYNNTSLNVQRQMGSGTNEESANPLDAGNPHARKGFQMGDYFGDLFHPERHHTSSLPYAMHDTNNVMGLRMFPLNMHVRLRVEGVRIRTEDLLHRMRDHELCAAHGLPLQSPLPERVRAELRAALKERQGKNQTLYSGALDPSQWDASAATTGTEEEATKQREAQRRRQHLRGGPSQPRPEDLSIFTRPQDLVDAGGDSMSSHGMPLGSSKKSVRAAALHYFSTQASAAPAEDAGMSARCSFISHRHPQYWMPLQMLKPMGQSFSYSMRSSGVRGPSMQLMQERLDQKGFGWKRKSRSLWQQDVDTAGFRPHRYF